jgi:uncharacterized protein YyaL (SSP411 family)
LLPTREAILGAAQTLIRAVDWQAGGIGGAPKFPNPMIFDFLWRASQAFQNERAGAAVVLTLTKMACGGIYDQLGGGFHRYSVDDTWSVPHFEKMLYDNGLLLRTYSQVLLTEQALEEPTRALFSSVVGETVNYLIREMLAPEGAFYAAQDADTPEGEGEYFAWNPELLAAALSAQEAAIAADFYGVTEAGNFEHGKTVLYRPKGLAPGPANLASIRQRLLEARSHRTPPGIDRKIIASWNGLAISGLVWASRALHSVNAENDSKMAWDAATGAFAAVLKFLTCEPKAEGRLKSVYAGGSAKHNAYLDDYAFLAQAALDLARFETNAPTRAF